MEAALFEDLPAVGGDQFVVGIEDHQVEVIPGGFEEYQVFAAIIVQVARNHIGQPPVFDWGFITVEFG